MKRSLYTHEKKPIYTWKEAYIHMKRSLYIHEKKPIYTWKEAFFSVCEKKPIYTWKEACIYMKRDVYWQTVSRCATDITSGASSPQQPPAAKIHDAQEREWVMSHIWTRHVTRIKESCRIYECVISHVVHSRHSDDRLPRIWSLQKKKNVSYTKVGFCKYTLQHTLQHTLQRTLQRTRQQILSV